MFKHTLAVNLTLDPVGLTLSEPGIPGKSNRFAITAEQSAVPEYTVPFTRMNSFTEPPERTDWNTNYIDRSHGYEVTNRKYKLLEISLAHPNYMTMNFGSSINRTLYRFFGRKFIRPVPYHSLSKKYARDVADTTLEIAGSFGFGKALVETDLAATIMHSSGTNKSVADLGELFRKHGTDKSTKHDYHLIYGAILDKSRYSDLQILEIGIGTNRAEVASNMGKNGRPGASLYAWCEWAPKAVVYAADVDTSILIQTERIRSFFVDQNDPTSFKTLVTHIKPGTLDIIVDDGIHEPLPSLNTMLQLIRLLKRGGYYCVEDIVEVERGIWVLLCELLRSRGFDCYLGKRKCEFFFAVRTN